MQRCIDINCDMGEGFGVYRLGADELMMPHITSANVACGFHAGDPMIMDRTVRLARQHGVAVGAHPSFPDLWGFGRRALGASPEEVRNYVIYQVGALEAFARSHGVRLQHVKPHGAVYNMAARDRRLARALAEGVKAVNPELIFVALANSALEEEARELGLRVASEAFADRAYRSDGTLVPRGQPGAVLRDVDQVVRQVLSMLRDGFVQAQDGSRVPVRPHTICVHGDTPGAPDFVAALARSLQEAGVELRPMSEVVG